MGKNDEWTEFDIQTLSLEYGQSYHPLEHNQDMEVKRGYGWAPVLYFYVLDEYVGVWCEPLMDVKATKIDKTVDKVKFRVKARVPNG